MENASQALIIAFSVIIFVIALTITISMFSMARATSDFVIFKSDETNYYEYDEIDNYEKNDRIVGMETIIPTLYRYYKENYKVEIYKDETEENPIKSFDVDTEINNKETWTGSQEGFKGHVDEFVKETLLIDYKDAQFKEVYSTEITNATSDETEKVTEEDDEGDKEKIVIKYIKIQK